MRILVFTSLFLLILGCANTIVSPDAEKKLTTTTEFPGQSSEAIFNRAMEYLARNYKSANDVIQLSDQKSGKIIAKGINFSSGKWDLGIKRPFSFTMVIDVKPERMRVKYENIESISLNRVGGPDLKYQWNSVQDSIDLTTSNLIEFVNDDSSDDW